ncbi:S-adenosyl-L-methionine-dependent methyltransferase [Xylaria bambusicola]|uniref:S-adenosyl-L-methionine-dependent methyltransferase n=1 Tax=Xylaria bambusicola TaxID=326684 RepID=UPI00200864E9|nr:S-adenosyl-L-methionine-dependent methyltransferase [Xylaria bambusicola]KAI0509032.1 S-adenosyl-L-methionine-dependent methyltransferase [Xylaria bambusicola]
MADVYMENMTRLPSETFRLNQQFDLMTKNMGYILHPSLKLPPVPHIADIGTGTARFIICLHPQFPEAVFEGFDISPALFPPRDALPSSVTLSVLDLKQPFLEDMHGQYDLVHLRLLVSAMRPEDWAPAVRNIFLLLRPGGYIQWEECEFLNAEWRKTTPDARFETAKSMTDAFSDALHQQFQHGWNTLPKQMREAGFTSVVTDVVSSDRLPETRSDMTASILSLVFTWARMMTDRGTSGPLFGDHLGDLEKAVHQEIKSGGYFKFNIHVACGQKPPV